jgi:hypothetical protein
VYLQCIRSAASQDNFSLPMGAVEEKFRILRGGGELSANWPALMMGIFNQKWKI